MENKTWAEREAEDISKVSDGSISKERILNLIEVAGEMKTVKLKVLLAQCYEIITTSENNNEAVLMDGNFASRVLFAIS